MNSAADNSRNYCQLARQCCNEGNHGKAFAYYLLSLKIGGDYTNQLKPVISREFGLTWKIWVDKLVSLNKAQDVMSLYEEAVKVFDECPQLHFHMAMCLFKIGMKLPSLNLLLKSYYLDPCNAQVVANMENLSSSLMQCWHFSMLNDVNRNSQYQKAIEKCLSLIPASLRHLPVLDIGCGTGLLSLMAAECEPSLRVHACEESELMASIAKECFKLNNCSDKISLKTCNSSQLQQKYSLIFCEIFDASFFGEHFLPTFKHAHEKLLTKGGTFLPSRVRIKCALVSCETFKLKHQYVDHDADLIISSGAVNLFGKPSSSYNSLTALEPYTCEYLNDFDHQVVSNTVEVLNLDLCDQPQVELYLDQDISCIFEVKPEKNFNCLVQWFEVDLDKEGEFMLTNSPFANKSCWQQAIFPLKSLDFSSVNRESPLSVACNFNLCLKGLRLKSVRMNDKNISQHTDRSLVKGNHLFVSENHVLKLNNPTYYKHYVAECEKYIDSIPESALLTVKGQVRPVKVLIISSNFNPVATHLLRLNHKNKIQICHYVTLGSSKLKVLKRFYKKFASGVLRNQVVVTNKLDLAMKEKFDVIVSDLVEQDGMLSKGCLEAHCKCVKSAKISSSTLVLPHKLKVKGQCLSSRELLSRCKVLDESNKLYGIDSVLNNYCVSSFSGSNLNCLDCSKLSSPFTLFDDIISAKMSSLSTGEGVLSGKINVSFNNNGRLDAVVYWFDIQVTPEVATTTLEGKCQVEYWQQSAFVFSRNTREIVVGSRKHVELEVELCEELLFCNVHRSS